MKLLPTLFLFVFCFQVTTACSEIKQIDSKKKQLELKHDCKPLHMAIEKGEVNIVKKLINIKSQENKLTCIKYALQQTSPTGREAQFQAFQYLVEELIKMRLPDQKIILNNILKNYAVVYLLDKPEYTEYLLSVGALPKTPNEFGWFPVTSALWSANEWGCTKAVSLLINALSPEILALQNKTGETTLMQSIERGFACPSEHKLLAQKSEGLNLFDEHGNTTLHYLLMKIKRDMNSSTRKAYAIDLALLRILLQRGASTKIPNKQSITSSQLLSELQSKGCKCY